MTKNRFRSSLSTQSVRTAGMFSIIIPVFGTVNPHSLYLAVNSISAQSHPEKEVLVVEEHLGKPRLKGVAESVQAKFIEYDISQQSAGSKSLFSIGRARNVGLAHASGELVVMHDADILLGSRHFLRHLHSELLANPDSYLTTPLLRHLQRKEIKEWKADFDSSGDFYRYLQKCLLHEEYIVSRYPAEHNDFTVVSHPYDRTKKHRRYVALKVLYEQFKENPALWKGSEPLIFTPCVGKFFIACRTDHVVAVGGYCERYLSWGGDDGDLKWKLSQFLNHKVLQSDERFAQIHLDHERPYFSSALYERNKTISRERQEKGFLNVVKEDFSQGLLGAALRDKFPISLDLGESE